MGPVRVLHIVGQMSRGGVETWLMHVLRNVDVARVRMDFLVTHSQPGDYDDEIVRLGSSVLPCPPRAGPALIGLHLLATLRDHGPYHVVHSHVHHFSGFLLAIARLASVPVRIAHSHSDTSRADAHASLARKVYLRLMEAAVHRCATHGLAASGPAAAALFGPRWRVDGRWEVARCGLDFGASDACVDTATTRMELGVPPDALVVGHVGRFHPDKNQILLVRAAAEMVKREPSVYLVLVGDGPSRSAVEATAYQLGIRDRVVFAGTRADIPRVLCSFDVFVLPSLREGLPIVGLEAQAAGLPIVLSDRVTRELVVIPDLFTWRSPAEAPEAWADAALAVAVRRRPPACMRACAAALERSEFSLPRTLPALLLRYGVFT